MLICDTGTNFIGASRELRDALNNVEDERIRDFLTQHNCDMGGVWERHIRSMRSILNVMMANHSEQFNDEIL